MLYIYVHILKQFLVLFKNHKNLRIQIKKHHLTNQSIIFLSHKQLNEFIIK